MSNLSARGRDALPVSLPIPAFAYSEAIDINAVSSIVGHAWRTSGTDKATNVFRWDKYRAAHGSRIGSAHRRRANRPTATPSAIRLASPAKPGSGLADSSVRM